MYIALYDENQNHIANVDNVTYDRTERTYDADTFTAEGISDADINDAKIAVLCDDTGNQEYACFVDAVTQKNDQQTIKGIDFRTLFDTEVLLDYTEPQSFDGNLSAIFQKICNLVFDSADTIARKIPIRIKLPFFNIPTISVFGSLQDTYKIVNAYTFLKAYLKYYEFIIETEYIPRDGIYISFARHFDKVSIGLADFIHELTTTSTATNKTVATIKYKIETDDDGNPTNLPRPSTIATRYYYRNKSNNIVQSDEIGDIDGRIYPVKTKYFEAEYLSEAQFNAVYELTNARYVDNIIIDNNITLDPIDLSVFPLYTKVSLYYKGTLYKTLPISEKHTTLNGSGKTTKIKLGFKKILLTEIIKN